MEADDGNGKDTQERAKGNPQRSRKARGTTGAGKTCTDKAGINKTCGRLERRWSSALLRGRQSFP